MTVFDLMISTKSLKSEWRGSTSLTNIFNLIALHTIVFDTVCFLTSWYPCSENWDSELKSTQSSVLLKNRRLHPFSVLSDSRRLFSKHLWLRNWRSDEILFVNMWKRTCVCLDTRMTVDRNECVAFDILTTDYLNWLLDHRVDSVVDGVASLCLQSHPHCHDNYTSSCRSQIHPKSHSSHK